MQFGDAEPLVIQVPWPFLVEGITSKLPTSSGDWLKLTLKKSINDPWPKDFGGRSKWEVDRCKPWAEGDSLDTKIAIHLASQHNFTNNQRLHITRALQSNLGVNQQSQAMKKEVKSLKTAGFMSIQTPLAEVYHIARIIFTECMKKQKKSILFVSFVDKRRVD